MTHLNGRPLSTSLLLAFALVGGGPVNGEILDLSAPYAKSDPNPTPDGAELVKIAEAEPDVSSLVAIECGKVVAEYGDQSQIKHLFSITKSWTGLLLGILETEGLLNLDETLGSIWPDDAVWANVAELTNTTEAGVQLRKDTTVRQLVQMRGGYDMPG